MDKREEEIEGAGAVPLYHAIRTQMAIRLENGISGQEYGEKERLLRPEGECVFVWKRNLDKDCHIL